MPASSRSLRLSLLLSVIGAFATDGRADDAAGEGRGHAALLATYLDLRSDLVETSFGVPLRVDATVETSSLQGDVYGIVGHPFAAVEEALRNPPVWCDIVTLHFNVKSCRFLGASPASDRGGLQLFVETGRKHYVPPSRRSRIVYDLEIRRTPGRYLDVSLAAEEGPLGIRHVRIAMEAMPVDAESSFVHLRYAHASGFFARMAMRTYLATLGRNKVGFSITGFGDDGERVYVDGVEGAVERNAMRYHLAVVAYLDTRAAPTGVRFGDRLERWFALTERHPRQLHEMSRDEYLEIKRRERTESTALQAPVIEAQPAAGTRAETRRR